MRHSTKLLLKLALVCGIIGAAFCIAGFCFGFTTKDFYTAVDNAELNGNILHDGVVGVMQDVTGGEHDYEQTFDGIDSLELDAGVADCTIRVTDTDQWEVAGSGLPAGFSCKQNGSKLKIKCKKRTWFASYNGGAVLEINVPESAELDEVEIDAGVGTVEIGDFLKCRKMDIDCGVGTCSVSVDVSKKLEIDGGVGDINVTLPGREEDFDYDLDVGLGSLTLGDSENGGIGAREKRDNGADKTISVDGGVGDVTIEFEDYED